MSHVPSIDYSCARCGASRIYQLVPLEERPTDEQARAEPRAVASLDFTCARCGASQAYTLVPAGTAA